MTLQLRHLSSLLRGQKPKAPRPEVPGLAYYTAYTAPERVGLAHTAASPVRPEMQALDAMYGYYSAEV